MMDSQLYVSQAEYIKMSPFEKKLYEIKGVYIVKQPNYAEKATCGLYMEECKYKVYDETEFTP